MVNCLDSLLAWYQCILIIVELLICMQVLLVHFLFNIGHIANTVECFLVVHLCGKVVAVHHHGLALQVALILLISTVEEACLLCSHCVLLPLGMIYCLLRLLTRLDL